jgi:hypothetical protein
MTYLVFLEPEAEMRFQLLRLEYGRLPDVLRRFERALLNIFSTLETFPHAFPVIQEQGHMPRQT